MRVLGYQNPKPPFKQLILSSLQAFFCLLPFSPALTGLFSRSDQRRIRRTMASTPSVKGNDVEMTVSPSFSTTDKQDNLALARLGKKAVLKVGIHSKPKYDLTNKSTPASIRFPVHLGFQLYRPDHLGGFLGVSDTLPAALQQ